MKLAIKTIISIILFFLGGIIYLGYRSKTLLMFKWTDYLNISDTINSWRSFATKHPLPDWGLIFITRWIMATFLYDFDRYNMGK